VIAASFPYQRAAGGELITLLDSVVFRIITLSADNPLQPFRHKFRYLLDLDRCGAPARRRRRDLHHPGPEARSGIAIRPDSDHEDAATVLMTFHDRWHHAAETVSGALMATSRSASAPGIRPMLGSRSTAAAPRRARPSHRDQLVHRT
jgi:hypothetical protein